MKYTCLSGIYDLPPTLVEFILATKIGVNRRDAEGLPKRAKNESLGNWVLMIYLKIFDF